MTRVSILVGLLVVVSMLLVSCKFQVNRTSEGAPCVANVDCAGGKVCDKGAGVCVECLVDTQCADDLVCDPVESACVECIKDGDCDEGYCLLDEYACVECLEETDCPVGFCDQEGHVCRECNSDADCADEAPCIESACAAGLCLHVPGPDGKDCDDGDDCTDGDYCQEGECVAGQMVPGCEGQCTGKPNGATCDDGDLCTQFEQCVEGECKGQEVRGCNAVDNDKDGHAAPPDGADCNDDDNEVYPNAPELCDEKDNNCNNIEDEGCSQCKDEECNDGKPCTNDFCDKETDECVNPPKENCTPCKDPADCDDDDICTLDDCIAEVCQYDLIDPCGTDCKDPAECDDGNPCTVDMCENGFCEYAVPVGCCETGPEICDGKDNDCDGETDDVVEEPCAVENEWGVCKGVAACTNGESVCDAPAPSPDVCDGLDNDCDEVPDDNLGETSCGQGMCAHNVPNCIGGEEQTCHPFEGMSEEACDGKDNDCDGQVDEELGLVSCGLGPCFHEEPACENGATVGCDPFLGAEAEVCNGIDDNCDGDIDNTEVGCACTGAQTQVCGLSIGDCHKGTQYCDDGQWSECGGGLYQPPVDEVCDAKDNDCDGSVDEELGIETCGLGVCLHSVEACQNGNLKGCEPMEGASEEVCDNLDNDCDGNIDDGLGDHECGQGVCLQVLPNCKNGGVPLCNPYAGAGSEICNNKDDDCDGVVDNVPPAECYNESDFGVCFGEKKCEGGEEYCDAQVPQAEICGNQADDNCDGGVDESCPECGVTGSCDELCSSQSQGSICNPNDPALECLSYTSCVLDETTGDCAWEQNEVYAKCLNEVCAAQSEICDNGQDDNCNGEIDEGCNAECQTDCDCYESGLAFPQPCGLACPGCDNYWKCEEDKCVDHCDFVPIEVQACLDGCAAPYNYIYVELAQLAAGDYSNQNKSTDGQAFVPGENCWDNPNCGGDEDCCWLYCSAELYLKGIDISGSQKQIHIHDGSVDVGCEGTKCDYLDNCTPFKAGDNVLVWGTMAYYQNAPSMILEGFCFK